MTQALLNNLIKPQSDLSEKLTNSKFDIGTDFQKVFENQHSQIESKDKLKNQIGANAKDANTIENNEQNKDNVEFNGLTRDIKDLIAYIEATSKESTEETKTDTEELTESIEDLKVLEESLTTLVDEEAEDNSTETTATETTDNTEETTINSTEIKDINLDQLSQIQTILPAQNTTDTSADENSNQDVKTIENDNELKVTLNGKEITNFEDLTNLESSNETTVTTKSDSITETEGKTLEEIVDEDMLKELKVESAEVDSQSSNSENSDIMQNQSPEEQGIKAIIQSDADFSTELKQNTQTQTTTQTTGSKATTDVTPSKIIEQITKQMEGLQNNSKVNIVLNPESLGKVSIQLINTKEGLSAQFTVASQEARNLIMKGIDSLKDTLISHGVSVDNVTVKLNNTQESEYNTDWTEQEGSRGGNKEQNPQREQRDKEQFEKMMSFVENENGKV